MVYVIFFGGISYVEADSKEEAINEFFSNPTKIAGDTDINRIEEIYKPEDLR